MFQNGVEILLTCWILDMDGCELLDEELTDMSTGSRSTCPVCHASQRWFDKNSLTAI